MNQAFEIHHDIPEADYHARAGCSASQLRTLLTKSAAHLAHQRRHPQEETSALRVGRLLHCMVLTPHLQIVATQLWQFLQSSRVLRSRALQTD